MNVPNNLKQPKVFTFSIVVALFERYGFYALSFLLVLYVKNVFSFSDHDAFTLFGVFNALVFLTPALGGYLADNIIGIRRTLFVGLILETLALCTLGLPTEKSLLIALALMVIGVGLFKVGPTDLIGRSYSNNDPRIDSGFTLFYMAMNAGAVLSPVITGYLQRFFGWHIAFLFGGIVIFLGIIAYFILQHRAAEVDSHVGKQKLPLKIWLYFIGGIIVATVLCVLLLNFAAISNIFFALATSFLLLYFANEIRKSPKQEKLEIIACLSLIVIGMVFFIMYFQLFMSMTLFTDRCVDHNLFGLNLPTSAFLGLNSFWVIAFSPLLVWLYNKLEQKKKDLKITYKFTLGLFSTSLCFLILYASHFIHDETFHVSNLWIVAAIGVFSFGELLISALGVAMVTRIAPKRMYGVMMGAWFLIATSLASTVSGKVSDLASVPSNIIDPAVTLSIYSKAFLSMGIVGIILSIVVLGISPYINKIAHLK